MLAKGGLLSIIARKNRVRPSTGTRDMAKTVCWHASGMVLAQPGSDLGVAARDVDTILVLAISRH